MDAPSYGLLDQAEEDALHKDRLLPIEQRPFQRITKRLLAADSPIRSHPKQLPTPPPDSTAADEAATTIKATKQQRAEELQRWRDEMNLDFEALEDNMVRLQLLRTSNERERARYAAEKDKILDTAQAVRENTAELRAQLDEARRTLALRREYDQLTERITSNRMLRPREDQHAQLAKLHAEIAELRQESAEYARTWSERREQFGRIVEEGKAMLRLIRDEKEEAERKEGMMAGDADEAGSQGSRSRVGTPRPEGTPMHAPGGASEGEGGLKPPPSHLRVAMSRGTSPDKGSRSRSRGASRSRSPRRSRGASPARSQGSTLEEGEEKDVEMGEIGTGADSEMEEGEEEEGEMSPEKMEL